MMRSSRNFDPKTLGKIEAIMKSRTSFDYTGIAVDSTWTQRNSKHAAVLVPLCNRFGEASVLFTVRTNTVSTHKGQVSFPGGHMEPGETFEDTAVRETREEIGKIGNIKILGKLGLVPAVTGTLVCPVLGFVESDVMDLSSLQPNKNEVADLFTISIDNLLNPTFRELDDLGRRGKCPAFTQSPYRVWGLTAFIMEEYLQICLAGIF